jgi:hypothetical protein
MPEKVSAGLFVTGGSHSLGDLADANEHGQDRISDSMQVRTA